MVNRGIKKIKKVSRFRVVIIIYKAFLLGADVLA